MKSKGVCGCVMKRCEWGAVSVLRVRKIGYESVVTLKILVVCALLSLIDLCVSTVDESEKKKRKNA